MPTKTEKKSKKKSSKLPPDVEQKKTHVLLGNESIRHTSSYESSTAFQAFGYDNSFSLEKFQEEFKINILADSDEQLTFEMIGVDAPIANAFRRILISEVPTVAIETVRIRNNTGVVQDEVLSHRLGLIPIKVDPRLFDYPSPQQEQEDAQVFFDTETIQFTLNVTCTKNPKASNDDPPEKKYKNEKVFSRDLKWVPLGKQAEMFEDIRPVFEDILITKLRPGQSIDLDVFCVKGVGKDHAKFSPVSTATYRLKPDIIFQEPILNEEAEELKEVCPMNVFDIEDIGGDQKAVVARPLNCTMCRECIRDPKRQEKIQLGRVKNHFIFDIESVGILPARTLFTEAVNILIEKCNALEREIESFTTSRNEMEEDQKKPK